MRNPMIRGRITLRPRGKPPFTRYVKAREDANGILASEPFGFARGSPDTRGDPG